MKLDFCAVCGSKEDLHQHHFFPVVHTNKKRKHKENEEITLCYQHHLMMHGLERIGGLRHGEMIKKGLEKAKENGVVLGRPKLDVDMEKVQKLKDEGLSFKKMEKKLNCSAATLCRVLKNGR